MPTLLLLLSGSILCASALASPLAPVRTDHPRDTMKTFMDAMNDYRKGVETDDEVLLGRITAAVRTLNLEHLPQLVRTENGERAARLLKEVIDRVIVINYRKIPDHTDSALDSFWRLKDTEITIRKVESGPRAGEWLFSSDTVTRAREFFDKVKHLPYKKGSGLGSGMQQSWVEEKVPEWAKKSTLGLFRWQWLGLLVAIFLGLLGKWAIEKLVLLAKYVARKSKGQWDDRVAEAIEGPVGLIGATAIWFLLLKGLKIEGVALDVLKITLQVIFSCGVIWLFLRLSSILTDYLLAFTRKTDFPIDDQLVPLLNRALRLFIVVFGVLVSIQNLGVNVMSLLAGLGLGGLAFALAAKDTAANLFGSIMILWDQPFKVGDWIIAGGTEGTVEEIGFRSTRIRTFYNSVVSVPNSSLANADIDNMGRRRYRRIKTTLGLTYDTTPQQMEGFLEGVKNIVLANPFTRKDYFHIVFNDYGASSLNVLLYCFLEVPNWGKELVERQNILLEIFRLAKDLGVEFAFPTQSLHVASMPDSSGRSPPLSNEELTEEAAAFAKGGAKSQPGGFGIFTPPFPNQKS